MTDTPIQPQKTKWYFKTSTLIIVLLSVGPLALPLLWLNPTYSKAKKIIWTLIILALSYALVLLSMDALAKLDKVMQQYKEMGLIK